jgi:DNA polymerase-4
MCSLIADDASLGNARQPMAGPAPACFLHADLDAFYASVEQRDDPALRGRQVIVGHGVVLAASYEARAHGVRTAMNGTQACRMCPDPVVVAPRMAAYSEASRRVFEVFADTTPLVEGISIDEAFLDVGGLRRVAGAPREIAARLRERVRDEVGLPLSVGIASTKFLAKVASAHCKPDGLLEVPAGGELAFLHPLPVRRIWGVGRVTEQVLNDRGVRTVGELAAVPLPTLEAWLGPASARHLHALAHNRDPRRVVTGRRRASVGAQRALGRRAMSRGEAEVVVLELVDRVTRRLRAGERLARTVEIGWRDHDMGGHSHSHTLTHPTDGTAEVLTAARALLDHEWPTIERRGLGLLSVTLANLDDARAVQLGLDFSGRDPGRLDATVDAVRARFGTAALTRGALVGRRGIEVPLLPDELPGQPS